MNAKVHDINTNQYVPEDVNKLRNGPTNERICTDIICLILFLGAFGALLYIWLIGWVKGDPVRIVAVYDSSNKSCGIDIIGKPYLYFSVPHTDWLNKTTCVSECPIYQNESEAPTELNCNKNFWHPNCSVNCAAQYYDIEGGFDMSIKFNFSDYLCIYNTTVFMDRVCIPGERIMTAVRNLTGPLQESVDLSQMQSWVDDLKLAWKIIAISVGGTFLLGIIYMFMIRIFSGVIVWGSIILYFAALLVLGAFLYNKSADYRVEIETNGEKDPYTWDNQQTYLITAFLVFAVDALSFLALFLMWKNIRLAISIIKTATLFMVQTPTAMLVPPLFSIITAGWWAFWLVGFVNIYSYGEIFKSDTSIFGQVKHEQMTVYFIWYFIFGGLWVNAFLEATTQFILASTSCLWYFSFSGDGHAPVFMSIYRVFRYHFGSIAFGSFILALVQFVRIVLAYIQRTCMAAKDNKCVQVIIRCLSCCLDCFERFIKFLNKQAYIQIALSGRNFCSAAKEGMRIIWANADRVMLVNGIGIAFIFIGKLFIIIVSVIGAYQAMINIEPYKTKIHSPFLPCIFVFIVAYAISTIFMQVYGMAIDSILMCFLYDEELCKGSKEGPKYAPDLLKEFFVENIDSEDKNKEKKKKKSYE